MEVLHIKKNGNLLRKRPPANERIRIQQHNTMGKQQHRKPIRTIHTNNMVHHILHDTQTIHRHQRSTNSKRIHNNHPSLPTTPTKHTNDTNTLDNHLHIHNSHMLHKPNEKLKLYFLYNQIFSYNEDTL